eukprot:872373-Prymnesium_polylepis.1
MGGVTRPADHPFAARRCLAIEPVAHRQSSEYPTKQWAVWAGCWTLLDVYSETVRARAYQRPSK